MLNTMLNYSLGIICGGGVLFSLLYRFLNPKLTETQLVIRLWYGIIIILVCGVVLSKQLSKE